MLNFYPNEAAEQLETLYTDAQTNKADWLTASAGIVGVLGIGMGWWWADPLAAIFISIDIVKDGYTQTRGAITDLMDRRPETIEGETDPIPYQVRDFLARQPGVREAEVRFREHGHLLFGEAFLLIDPAQPFTAEEMTRLSRETCQLHWRLAEVAITLRQY